MSVKSGKYFRISSIYQFFNKSNTVKIFISILYIQNFIIITFEPYTYYMNNTAPTFAKQDSLKFFRTLNLVNSYLKKKQHSEKEIETIPKNNNFFSVFLLLTFNSNTWHAILGTPSIDDCHGNWYG
jgi:hypothetical protein